MSRLKEKRLVKHPSTSDQFKSAGVPRQLLAQMSLPPAEHKTLRMDDHEGLDQVESTKETNIFQSTFTGLIKKACRQLSKAVVKGKALIIQDRNSHLKDHLIGCNDRYRVFPINISSNPLPCTYSGSANLENSAEQFEHIKCCRGRRGRR